MDLSEISTERRKVIGECIGILAMEWAHMEFVVDGLISIFHDFFFGKEVEIHKPRSFKRKIRYMRACFTKLETMMWASPYLPILEEMEDISEIRNWFIHGVLIEANDDQTIKFIRHNYDTRPVGVEYKTVLYSDIYNAAVEIRRLDKIVRDLFSVVDEFLAKHVDVFRSR